jgi:hypothetical protein
MFEPQHLNTSLFSNLLETAKLELAGAEHRLDVAQRAYREFVQEHGMLNDDGEFVYASTPAREMFLSLEHERESLECEIDEAHRRVRHSNEIISDMTLCVAIEADNIADVILGLPQEGDEAQDVTEVPGAKDQL